MKIINRIKASQDFALTIKKGKALRSKSFVIHFVKNDFAYTRVGISVSTKLGNAVLRNRVKRQIRAMCDQIICYDHQSFDIVIIAKDGFLSNSYADNKSLLSELLIVQVGLINEEEK